MTRPLTLFTAVVSLVALAGCQKHDPDPPGPPSAPAGVVRFTVKPMWNGSPFDKTVVYTNVSDHRVQVQQLKFYLGQLELDGPANDAALKDVDLFEVTDGPVTRFYASPVGLYEDLRFGVGVPYALNHTDPSEFPNTHPLSGSNGMYWTWASLYRFMIFDGRYDTVPGVGLPPYLFSIHTGRDTCYRNVTLESTLLVSEGDTADLTLRVDLDRFFYNDNDTLVLNETPQWHGESDQMEIGLRFSDLVSGAFDVE